MKTVIFLAALLLAANAFSFGSIGNAFKKAGNAIGHVATEGASAVQHAATDAGHGITNVASQAGHGITNAASQAGHGITNAASQAEHGITNAASIAVHGVTYAADTFANHIESLPGDVKSEFEFVSAKVTTLAQKGAVIAEDVANAIQEAATDIEEEAEEIAQYLNLALECVEAIMENAQIFLRFYEISEEPAQIILEWNPIAEELFNICVACSGQSESKFEWLKKIEIQGKDIDVAMCAADLIDFAKSAVEIANIDDDIDPMVILDFINSIIDMSDDCPSAIEYIEELADSSIPLSQKIADGVEGDSSDDEWAIWEFIVIG